MRPILMWIELENTIIDVTRSSWTTLNRINSGPSQLSELSPALRRLLETLQTLSNEARSSEADFQTGTEAEAKQLLTALQACESSCQSFRTIVDSCVQLRTEDQAHLLNDIALGSEGRQNLKARIINYSNTIQELSVGIYTSSTPRSSSPTIDVLRRVQAELVAEGVQVENLQPYHEEIKDYLRNLATSGWNATNRSQSQASSTSCESPQPVPIMFPTANTYNPISYPNAQQIQDMAIQVDSLFDYEAIRPHTIEIHDKLSPLQKPSSRKDSMDPESGSYTSRLSAALTNISFSIHVPAKSRVSRPPLPHQRSSSAVFRGLADEERATGD